jgi:hypothetical protein
MHALVYRAGTNDLFETLQCDIIAAVVSKVEIAINHYFIQITNR